MYEETKTEKIGKLTAKVTFTPDDCPIDPAKNGECGVLKAFYSRETFQDGLAAVFGKKKQEAVDAMLSGKVFWHKNIPYIGLEKYSHGAERYAACRAGNFPDRQWDVSPIVGFWSPAKDRGKQSAYSRARALKRSADSPECPACGVRGKAYGYACVECGTVPEDTATAALAEAEAILRKEMDGDIETWNCYVNGDIWALRVVLLDENDDEVEDEAYGGFYGTESAEKAAEEILAELKGKYGKQKKEDAA